MAITTNSPEAVQYSARVLADTLLPVITQAMRRGRPDEAAQYRLGTILLMHDAAPFLDCSACRDLLGHLETLDYGRH